MNQENDSLKYAISNRADYNKFTKEKGPYIKELLDTSISILGVNIKN